MSVPSLPPYLHPLTVIPTQSTELELLKPNKLLEAVALAMGSLADEPRPVLVS